MEAISGSRPSGTYKIPARIEKKNNVIYISFIQTRVYLCKKRNGSGTPIKNVGRGCFIKKIKNDHYKET